MLFSHTPNNAFLVSVQLMVRNGIIIRADEIEDTVENDLTRCVGLLCLVNKR